MFSLWCLELKVGSGVRRTERRVHLNIIVGEHGSRSESEVGEGEAIRTEGGSVLKADPNQKRNGAKVPESEIDRRLGSFRS